MPLYDYRCGEGHITTLRRGFSGYRDPVLCKCGREADLVILTPPKVFGDYEGYESPASGKWIEGRRAREEDFRRTGTRPYELGEAQDLQRRQAAAERAIDKSVDVAVEKTLAELTS
jgi:hypothetical protein